MALRVAAASGEWFVRAADLVVPAYALAQAARVGVIERVVPGVYLGPDWPRQPLELVRDGKGPDRPRALGDAQ